MGLWEDGTDREALAELRPGSARRLSSEHRHSAVGMT